MIFSIESVLTDAELELVVNTLEKVEFVDGKATAGWHAKLVKNNTQLNKKSTHAQELQALIQRSLKRNELFRAAVLPKVIHSILFSRYEVGMFYGRHVDNAHMGQQELLRSDISFTLFLTAPSSYTGGELVIEGVQDERAYKLEAGSMILYPASTLHRVDSVTEGTRLVAVGWVQSLVRDPGDREILFDLDTSRRSIFAREGKTVEFDLLSKSYSNLLRKWAD